jgi:hypothetical protein
LQVHGYHAKDVLTLGDNIRVEQQVFAQVTTVFEFSTCEAEEGVFGLAFSMISSHNYPSLLSNLDTSLLHSIYSLYLNPDDDYPDETVPFMDQDGNGNLESGGQQPLSSKSQIVFGGVDQAHYEGCLQWHELGQFEDQVTRDKFVGYWDFALSEVKVGGTAVSSSNVALVDSGSSYLVGPTDAIAKIATMNHASCFTMQSATEPQIVDCESGQFDAAIIDCDQPFFNLEFIADGHTYVLEKEDLMLKVATSFGEACILRLTGSEGIPVSNSHTFSKVEEGWSEGRVFNG